MPLHIGSVTADVTMFDGDLPLSERQLCRLAEHVVQILATREREARRQREATQIRQGVQPVSPVGG